MKKIKATLSRWYHSIKTWMRKEDILLPAAVGFTVGESITRTTASAIAGAMLMSSGQYYLGLIGFIIAFLQLGVPSYLSYRAMITYKKLQPDLC